MIRRDRGLNLNTNWIFLNRNACRNTRITSQGKISGLYFYEIIITIPPSFYNPQGRDHKTESFIPYQEELNEDRGFEK